MAVTLKRLGLVFLALGAVLLPALRAGDRRPLSKAESQYLRLVDVQRRLGAAAFRWAALAERDSAALPASRVARAGRPAILFRGFPSGTTSPVAEGIVAETWKAIGTTDSSVRVALVVFNVGGYVSRDIQVWPYSGASIVPEPGGGTTCVALTPGERVRDQTVQVDKNRLRAALSPCVLLAAFGEPGSAVGTWLGATRYAMAGSSAWLDQPRSFIDGHLFAPWSTSEDETSQDMPVPLLLASGLARSISALVAPPYALGAPGLRCIAGIIASCRDNAVDTAAIAEGTRGLPGDLTFVPDLLDRMHMARFAAPRPPQAWWLSDLIRDQGREKFVRFWTSSGTFERAFLDSFGQDIGTWTHAWAVRQWEHSWWEQYYRHQPRMLGATLRPSWPLLVLGWTGVALLAAAWAARRRQAT